MTVDIAPSDFLKDRLQDFQWLSAKAAEVLKGDVQAFWPGQCFQVLQGKIGTTEVLKRDGVPLIANLSENLDPPFGFRLMTVDGDPSIKVLCTRVFGHVRHHPTYDPIHFVLKARYEELRKRVQTEAGKAPMPFLAGEMAATFKWNTIQFLDRSESIYREYGIPFRRGVILTGIPGTGKTFACRWLVGVCSRKGYQHRVVAPHDYLDATESGGQAVTELFRFEGGKAPSEANGKEDRIVRGVIIFDDIDIALRNRQDDEGWHQATFLSHLEGVERPEGIVYIFTTNSPVEQLDPAILRPGRIDAVLEFEPPTEELVRRFIHEVWPDTVTEHLPEDAHEDLVGLGAGKPVTYAEIDEVKRLFVLHYLDEGSWDWSGAIEAFSKERGALKAKEKIGLVSSP